MPPMIPKLLRANVALLICASLAFSGCGSMPPYSALFDTSPEAEGTGIVGVGLVRAVVIIAKYQATERQRQVATQRARAVTRKLQARAEPVVKKRAPISMKSAPKAQAKTAKPAKTRIAAEEPSPSPREEPAAPRKAPPIVPMTPAVEEEEPAPEPPPVKKQAAKKRLPRYIAVDTEPDARSKGGRSVMIWDTQAEAIVGNNVYDVATPPRMLETVKFETYSAEYVGTGL